MNSPGAAFPDDEQTADESRRSRWGQFHLSTLLRVTTLAAFASAASLARETLSLAVGYTVVTVVATWWLVGRWSSGLTRRSQRKALAATAAMLVAGGAGLTFLIGQADSLPLIFVLELVPLLFVVFTLDGDLPLGILLVVLTACGVIALVYFVVLGLLKVWDRLEEFAHSAANDQRPVASAFSILLGLLALPLLLTLLLGDGYRFIFHGEVGDTPYMLLHCLTHGGMALAAIGVIVVLQLNAQRPGPWPNRIKLLTFGYVCLYLVLLEVAFFPIRFSLAGL